MKKSTKMNTKNLMVSFCTFALALFLLGTVSAADIATDVEVKVEGVQVYNGGIASMASVDAGETITVKVYFTALEDDTDVTVEVELEGDKDKVTEISRRFVVEENGTYGPHNFGFFNIEVPFELKDQLSDKLKLNIEIDGREYETKLPEIVLKVQRPSYNPVVKSITTPSSIDAGETFPVDIVLKNMGYNELEDVYVSAKIVELGVSQGSKWFGDIAELENCSDDCDLEDTVYGKFYLEVPYSVKEGIYTLEVTVTNDDVETTEVKQIVIKNDFSQNVVSVNTEKTVAIGEDAVYEVLIVNPTNNVKVYKIVSESKEGFSSTATETIVAVPAGSSKTVKVLANAEEEGSYMFDVNIFSAEELVDTATFKLNVEGKQSNTIVILTIALAIIFLVLLVVLIVLLGKKPEKSEEFGESYY